jgi:hypothetical protein
MLNVRRREFITLLGGAAAWPVEFLEQLAQLLRPLGLILHAYPHWRQTRDGTVRPYFCKTLDPPAMVTNTHFRRKTDAIGPLASTAPAV